MLCLGDVKLHITLSGVEYSELMKGGQKLELGSDYNNVRATDGSERDPVAVFNLFARNRPEKMKAGIKTTGFKVTAAERH